MKKVGKGLLIIAIGSPPKAMGKTKRYTPDEDMKFDKKHGIKEDSKEDKKLDKLRGIKESQEKRKKKK